MKKILFVCTGNICRSPSAEAILRKMTADLGKEIFIDSAGTSSSWQDGTPPDDHAVAVCNKRGYDMQGISSRQLQAADLAEFDLIYAMTESHRQILLHYSPIAAEKIRLFIEAKDVPDPYGGGASGFEEMMDILEVGCATILTEL